MAEVDRYRATKLREGSLAPETINKHLVRLGQILDRAVRIVAPVVRRAGKLLERRGEQPLPSGVTPHKLRHTFAQPC